MLLLKNFPGAIPNKLQQDLRILMDIAKVPKGEFVLLENLAADIFMDGFAPKFTVAAKASAKFVRERAPLYESFWEIKNAYDAVLVGGGEEGFDLGKVIGQTLKDCRFWKGDGQTWISR